MQRHPKIPRPAPPSPAATYQKWRGARAAVDDSVVACVRWIYATGIKGKADFDERGQNYGRFW